MTSLFASTRTPLSKPGLFEVGARSLLLATCTHPSTPHPFPDLGCALQRATYHYSDWPLTSALRHHLKPPPGFGEQPANIAYQKTPPPGLSLIVSPA